MKIEKPKTHLIDIKLLKQADYNPRKLSQAQFDAIAESISKFGFIDPIIVNKHPDRENVIIGGHQRRKVAESLGYDKLPAIFVEYDLEQERELNIRLNQNAGEWDWELLVDHFAQAELKEWGFQDDDLSAFDQKEDKEISEDEPPEPPKKAKTKLGDIYQLGPHRLMCGDSTSEKDVAALMQGQKADMVFTDPPYNLNFDYATYDDNKSSAEYAEFCSKWLARLNEHSDSIIITPGKQNLAMWYRISVIRDVGIWYSKNKMSGGKISNLSLWEPVIFIGKFNRSSRATDIFDFNVRQQKDTGSHTCPKVIEFIADILKSYSSGGECILDLFGGSGTTLIASENIGRACRMMELDPIYCDLIVQRYCNLKGIDAAEVFKTKKAE